MPAVVVEQRGAVAVISLRRPEKRNALRYEDLRLFGELVAEAGRDPAVRALVVTGSGGSFCAGIDLADLSSRTAEQRTDVGWSGERGAWFLADCPTPVVAAVDGPAVGMGAEISCQADLRVASTGARFAWNFTARGLVPDMGVASLLLPHIVGLPATLDLLYTGRFLGAEEALALRYVQRVVAPGEEVDAAVELAGALAAGSPFALRRIKALVLAALGDPAGHLVRHRAALAECLASDDHREGVAAFLERRTAVFGGS